MEGMKGTMADFEIEGINETKYMDVYKADLTPKQEAERMLNDHEVKKHVKKFVDACAEGGVNKVNITATDGTQTASTCIDIPKHGNDG